MSEHTTEEAALFPERVGDTLRAARTKAGLDLSDIATKTRVPLRHLTAIENGDYGSLPGITYCVGFTKAYARCVGEDEVVLSERIREELGQQAPQDRYEPVLLDDDGTGPVPTRNLAWTAAGVAALLLIGYLALRNDWSDAGLSGNKAPPVAQTSGETAAAPGMPAAAPANTTGEVVLTAKAPVWLRVYDSSRKRLFEKEMVAGERYVVPADATGPQIWTGHADFLTVTVGGKEVAPLGPPDKTVKDIGISAAALAARPAPVDPLAANRPVSAAIPVTAPANPAPRP